MRIGKLVILNMHAKTIDFHLPDFACFMRAYKKDEELTSSRLALQQQVSEGNQERRRHDDQLRAHSAE